MSKPFVITNWSGKTFEVIIDADRYDEVMQSRWYVVAGRKTLYVKATAGKSSSYLHHLIIGKPSKGMVTDHINGNGLDNRACNLRHCTIAENGRNRGVQRDNKAGLKGVNYEKRCGKWRAQARVNRVRQVIGFYDTAQEAYKAYCDFAKANYGEFCYQGLEAGAGGAVASA